MSNWNDVTDAAPDLAADVRARFEAHGLGLLATLRSDGAPRISGIEPWFDGDDVWIGMMFDSRKARDLQRDPRLCLHSATIDTKVTDGDARLSGLALEVLDDGEIEPVLDRFEEVKGYRPPPGPMHLFRIDVTELLHLSVADDHLVIRTWTPERGERRVERR